MCFISQETLTKAVVFQTDFKGVFIQAVMAKLSNANMEAITGLV